MNNPKTNQTNTQRSNAKSITLFRFSDFDETVIVFSDNKTLRHKRGFDDADNLFCDVDAVGTINPIHWRELTAEEAKKFGGAMAQQAAEDAFENERHHEAIRLAEKW